MTTQDQPEGSIEIQAEQAYQDTLQKLRHCLPDVADADLLLMAKYHPDTRRRDACFQRLIGRYAQDPGIVA